MWKKWLAKSLYSENNKVRNTIAESNMFIRRALIAFIGVLILSGILFANLFYLQVSEKETYTTRADGNRIKLLAIEPERGLIYDRNGKVLAENETYFGLYIVPEKVENLDEALERLKKVVDLTDEEIELFRKEKQHTARHTPIQLKGNLTEEQIARFSVDQFQFEGIDVRPYFRRTYPYGALMAHILGYVSRINDKDVEKLKEEGKYSNYAASHDIGKLGIERYYEDVLHGTVGFEEVEVNNRGKILNKLRSQAAIPGSGVRLTIDVDLQTFVTDLMRNRVGAAVVLDSRNSEILAMVTTPNYDNNLFVGGISDKDYKILLDNPDRPLYGRVNQGVYPPASTIKPFMAVAALTEGVITPNTVINDPGYWQFPGMNKRFRDWKKGGHGATSLVKAITESSDTFFYDTAYKMGIERISSWMGRFGFGKKTGIDLIEESTGLMPTKEWKLRRHKKEWLQGDTIPIGIGQGYWVSTPLQLAKALTILINNGKANTPHLMKEIIGKTVHPYKDQHELPDIKGVSAQSWQLAKKGMYCVVNCPGGTGAGAFRGTNYHVAGKSGTAQVFSLNGGNYNAAALAKHLHDHGWFIAYAPYENPRYAVAMILENAGGGSKNVAPLVRRILDYSIKNDIGGAPKPPRNTENDTQNGETPAPTATNAAAPSAAQPQTQPNEATQ